MKTYMKPTLKALGLLRTVTKFSGSDPKGGEWGNGHAFSMF
ncbi:MAG TPA: hypothetical protein VN846_05015 [Candidatus Cybelea sp.]|nr:hypothetical protein [Candidatus Cybelea sp.]